MNGVGQALTFVFVLSLVLVVVAYYTGFASDLTVFSTSLNNILLTSTGRNSNGDFAAYPASN